MLLTQKNTELPKGVRAVKQRGMSVKPVAGLSADGQQRFIEEMFLLPGIHRGINIIGASGGAEFALESAQWNNGVFTATIIEALRDKKADLNGDTRISVGELRDYLAKRVPELTRGAQKPSVVAAERDQDFDLVRKTEKAGSQTSEQNNAGPKPQASVGIGASISNSLGQKYVPIPGLDAYFCIWDTRVSDYEKFVKETNLTWKPAGFAQGKDHPAVRVTYNDAVEFCQWLTRREQAQGTLPSGYEYRLPKDLEWSAAAGITGENEGQPGWRSGDIASCYAWGSSWPPPPNSGNYDPRLKTDKFPNTSPVGSFAPNKYGLFDMNGNVYQWIKEDYDENGQGCLRGAAWADEVEESINLTSRWPANKDDKFKCYGFRCVLAPIE